MRSRTVGRHGEWAALFYLWRKGYRLLARNYRAGRHEIDLVMQDGKTLVFVEVKARSEGMRGTPGEAVDCRKQRFLILAAECYIAQHRAADMPARFDVVEYYAAKRRIVHIKDAFTL